MAELVNRIHKALVKTVLILFKKITDDTNKAFLFNEW